MALSATFELIKQLNNGMLNGASSFVEFGTDGNDDIAGQGGDNYLEGGVNDKYIISPTNSVNISLHVEQINQTNKVA